MKTNTNKTKKSTAKQTAEPAAEKTVTLKHMPKESDKLPKQALTILETLKAHKGKLSVAQLIDAIAKKLETVQPPKRIFVFYRKRLVDGGFIAA